MFKLWCLWTIFPLIKELRSFFFWFRDVSNNIILLLRRNKFFHESPINNYYLFPKHLGFFPRSASCNHQKLKKTKTWSCTQHSAVTSHPEHMERKWHHSVTWSRSSGTPKQAFYSTPFTHRETFRLRRFSTLLWGLLQILRIPHTGMGYFWWYPHDLRRIRICLRSTPLEA